MQTEKCLLTLISANCCPDSEFYNHLRYKQRCQLSSHLKLPDHHVAQQHRGHHEQQYRFLPIPTTRKQSATAYQAREASQHSDGGGGVGDRSEGALHAAIVPRVAR